MIDEEIEDFVEDESVTSSDLFDCDYTPIDAVVNQITVFTGCTTRATENGDRLLVAYGEGAAKSAFSPTVKSCGMCFATQIANSLSVPLSRW